MELFIKISGFFLSLASSTGGLREREVDKEDDKRERERERRLELEKSCFQQ